MEKFTNKLDLYAIRCHGRVRNLHLSPNNSNNNDSRLVEFHVFDFARHALKMSTLQIRGAQNNYPFSDNECYLYILLLKMVGRFFEWTCLLVLEWNSCFYNYLAIPVAYERGKITNRISHDLARYQWKKHEIKIFWLDSHLAFIRDEVSRLNPIVQRLRLRQ